MADCLFCKFVSKEIPVTFVCEDDAAIAIRDINPQAPDHFLVIPKEHFEGIHEVPGDRKTLFEGLLSAASRLIDQQNLAAKGYRLVINFGEKAGQTVPHIHVHVLSGRQMHWPPG